MKSYLKYLETVSFFILFVLYFYLSQKIKAEKGINMNIFFNELNLFLNLFVFVFLTIVLPKLIGGKLCFKIYFAALVVVNLIISVLLFI
jgi:hypothetical protein